MSPDQKRLFERQMETFAAFAEHTDAAVGRLVKQLEDIGELDDALFFYIVRDNGSSAEGGPEGTYNVSPDYPSSTTRSRGRSSG